MAIKRICAIFLTIFALSYLAKAQSPSGISNEIGVVAGNLLFQADFGQRNSLDTNLSNLGTGIGIVHYINFSYRGDKNYLPHNVYFDDHFKIRSEIDYHFTKFSHKGDLSKKNTDEGRDLRDHKGTTSVFEIGGQLEFFPLSIKDFQAGGFKIAPFMSLGAHYVHVNPGYSSVQDIPGATPEDIYFNAFLVGDGELGGLDSSSRSTFALVGSIGIRYKLSAVSDLVIELRHHNYFSDWMDGLNPNGDLYGANKHDDSITWLMLGYVYYLDF